MNATNVLSPDDAEALLVAATSLQALDKAHTDVLASLGPFRAATGPKHAKMIYLEHAKAMHPDKQPQASGAAFQTMKAQYQTWDRVHEVYEREHARMLRFPELFTEKGPGQKILPRRRVRDLVRDELAKPEAREKVAGAAGDIAGVVGRAIVSAVLKKRK